MITLTEKGKGVISSYIKELEAKKKEIIDAGKDTCFETNIPTEDDILDDIYWLEDNGEYWNFWGVTDNYSSDYALILERGVDYVFEVK